MPPSTFTKNGLIMAPPLVLGNSQLQASCYKFSLQSGILNKGF